MNALAQVISVTAFSLRTIPQRLGSVVTATVGIALVSVVLVGFLSIAEGFRAAMNAGGSDDVAVVLRSGADNEMTSILNRNDYRLIADAPGVVRTAGGTAASAELFVIIDRKKRSTGSDANVPFRGVSAAVLDVRPNIRITEGRKFTPGLNEVIVGAGAARAFSDLEVGRTIHIGKNEWKIVGSFSGGEGSADSEIWTDAAVLQPAYDRRESFQSIYVRLTSPEAIHQFTNALASNPQLKVKAMPEREFLAEQSSMMTQFIETIGIFIASLMALGALFGALNTMYNAVADRSRDIATLRALGFGSMPVILSVLFESLVLAIVGGIIGTAAAYIGFDGLRTATMNFQTFSQIAFAFAVTPRLMLGAIICSAGIGFLGGLFPAVRAARVPIAAALRET